jgi:polyhydroxybutyrate depolymerase
MQLSNARAVPKSARVARGASSRLTARRRSVLGASREDAEPTGIVTLQNLRNRAGGGTELAEGRTMNGANALFARLAEMPAYRRCWLAVTCMAMLFACSKPHRRGIVPKSDDSAPIVENRQSVTPPATDRLPFLLILHGFGGSGEQIERDLRLAAFAREMHFAYAVPDGTLDNQGRRFWNAGPVCCNFGHAPANDVERLSALVSHAIQSLRADPARIYVIGYSNGGFMAHRLACESARQIRAIVSISAAGPASPERCDPERPVAVLEIHGEKDRVVPLDGGLLFGRTGYPQSPPVVDGLTRWAKLNRCQGGLRLRRHIDLFEAIAGEETAVSEFSHCQKSPVQFWRVTDGTHVLPLGGSALAAIWQFIAVLPPES